MPVFAENAHPVTVDKQRGCYRGRALRIPARRAAAMRAFDDFHAAAHPVDLLWVVPLSEREYRLKREQGIDGLMPVFAENAHPVTVDKQRGCYLGGEGA